MRRRSESFAASADGSANELRHETSSVTPAISAETSAATCAPSAPACRRPLSAEPTRWNAAASKSFSPSAALKSSAAPPPFSK